LQRSIAFGYSCDCKIAQLSLRRHRHCIGCIEQRDIQIRVKQSSEVSMTPSEYRIESSHPLSGRLLPASGSQQYLVSDRALAVAMAAKSVTQPSGQEIRVVHIPTGEIVFRKAAASRVDAIEEF
jgi:hypothetical protein